MSEIKKDSLDWILENYGSINARRTLGRDRSYYVEFPIWGGGMANGNGRTVEEAIATAQGRPREADDE